MVRKTSTLLRDQLITLLRHHLITDGYAEQAGRYAGLGVAQLDSEKRGFGGNYF